MTAHTPTPDELADLFRPEDPEPDAASPEPAPGSTNGPDRRDYAPDGLRGSQSLYAWNALHDPLYARHNRKED